MFGPNIAIRYERARYGLFDGVPAPPVPNTAWDRFASGRALMAAGNLAAAFEQLSVAVALDPGGRWANFYYGLCAYRLGLYADAVASFGICIGVDPHVATFYLNRAISRDACGQAVGAAQDREQALRYGNPSAAGRSAAHRQGRPAVVR